MPHTRSLFAGLIAVIVLAFLAAPASATVLVQNTRAEWQALTSSVFTIDFEGLATTSVNPTYNTADGLTLGGIKFVGDNLDGTYYLQAFDSAMGGSYNWASGDYILGSGWGVKYIQVSLPANVTGAAADVMTNSAGHDVTVTLSTGGPYTVSTFANPTHAFIGFTSDTPIDWIRFSAAGSYTVIDNFSFGSVATPELDTRVLAGFGLAGLWLARRLRRFC
jgi:hypothetical protein